MSGMLPSCADDLVRRLARCSFRVSYEASRSYADFEVPLSEPTDYVRVDVVPVSRMKAELETRKSISYAPQVDVLVRRKFNPSNQASDGRVEMDDVDQLVLFVEEIHSTLVFMRTGGNWREGDGIWVEEEIIAAYIPSHLRKFRQFTGIIRVTYDVSKTVAGISN